MKEYFNGFSTQDLVDMRRNDEKRKEKVEMGKEIERLNNIINELEQWLEEAIEAISHVSLDGASGLDMALKKIKELKGSDKK